MWRYLKIHWHREAGPAELIQLAAPLVISTISWTLMGFIDRIFLTWYSTDAVAASMPAGMVHHAMVMFPLGIASYVNTFVAQYHGAGRPQRIGLAMWQGVWLALIATPIFAFSYPLAPSIFRSVGHDAALLPLEVNYFQTLVYCAPAVVIAASLEAFFTGRGVTKIVMWVNCLQAAVNILLDYAWIFGELGFDEFGISGAAAATVVSQWLKVIAYLYLISRASQRELGVLSGFRFDAPLFGRLMWYGFPNGLQMFIEMSAFTAFILFVGRVGNEEMAATTIAFNVNMIAFVPMLGLGIAVSTIVGQKLGEDRPPLAARATWWAFVIAMTYAAGMSVLFVLTPDLFLWGFSAGSDQDFDKIRTTVVILLRFVAAYCVFDAMHIVFVSAIKGAGDTRYVLLMTLIISPPMVFVCWVGSTYWDWKLMPYWWLVTGWVLLLGIVYWLRFLGGQWKQMRVIEPNLVEKTADELLFSPAR